MARLNPFLVALSVISTVNAYFLVGSDFITTERIDPIVNPGKVSGHVHSVLGGSNFRFTANTNSLRQSECTSMPIAEDKSNYWFPQLYFQWRNGSFTSVGGGSVVYYLFDKNRKATPFPDDFRMLSGNPTLRTYDPTNFGQLAITYLCLDFNGVTTQHNELPNKKCPSGIRSQVNFPSCWDGKNTDSPDHKSHVAYRSEGADKGDCKDPKFPVEVPRIFLEVYWGTGYFDDIRSQAMDPNQPFVFAYGDRTGYGNHADFLNGWDKGVLQKVVNECHCNDFGDPQCCADKGIFTLRNKDDRKRCHITKSLDEQTTGTIPKLPGNNPVQAAGRTATMLSDPNTPAIFSPVYAYTGDVAPAHGPVVTPAKAGEVAGTPAGNPDTPNTPESNPSTPGSGNTGSGSTGGSSPPASGGSGSTGGSGSGSPSTGSGSGSPSTGSGSGSPSTGSGSGSPSTGSGSGSPSTGSGSGSPSTGTGSGSPSSGSGSGSGSPSTGSGSGSSSVSAAIPPASTGKLNPVDAPTCGPSHQSQHKSHKKKKITHKKSFKAHSKRAMRLSRASSDMI